MLARRVFGSLIPWARFFFQRSSFNEWFGLVVWIPSILENERDCYLGVSQNSQSTGPQTNNYNHIADIIYPKFLKLTPGISHLNGPEKNGPKNPKTPQSSGYFDLRNFQQDPVNGPLNLSI